MSEGLWLRAPDQATVHLELPFDAARMIRDWSSLLPSMARVRSEAFTRVEWAYLMTFLDAENLWRPFLEEFGNPTEARGEGPVQSYRPRGQVALWLPNNVSLLGPLAAILISLSGCPMQIKLGSRGLDLVNAFFDFVRAHAPEGPLQDFLRDRVGMARFDRQDVRNQQMAASAAVRMVFGSDQAARSIEDLPHPPTSLGIYFTDRLSEAWVEREALSEDVVLTLARVFAVYGRRGCTSPARVVILGGTEKDATALRDRLATLWPRVMRSLCSQSQASECLMGHQLALARGWQSVLAPGHGAAFASGRGDLKALEGTFVLPITWSSPRDAAAALPLNIQTIGYALKDPTEPGWTSLQAESGVKRFVPLGTMHHFGHVWDGIPYWRMLFEEALT
jgi:hypothetical protein